MSRDARFRESKVARLVIVLAARLVPRHRREEWRREWEAEIDHHGGIGAGRPDPDDRDPDDRDPGVRARRDGGTASGGRPVRMLATLRRATAALPDALAVRRLEAGRRAPGTALWTDLRDAARTLRRSPGFSLALAAILALGVGANTAVFALVDGVLLQPLPYPESGRIVAVWERHAGGSWDRSRLTPATYFDIERGTRSFEAMSPIFNGGVNLTSEGEPLQVGAPRVSASYFDVLGVHPFLGRGFDEGDGAPGAEPVIILSHGLWRHRFGSDPEVVGRTIEVDGAPVRVAGVMPDGAYPTFVPTSAELQLRDGRQAWLPLDVSEEMRRNRRSHVVGGIGRLRPGVEPAAAGEELAALAESVEEVEELVAVGLREQVVGGARQGLWLLQGAVVLVALLVVANVTGLLLVRGASRERELAVRSALGAGRGRLARQLTLEALLVALAGGAAGTALAAVIVDALRAGGLDLPRLREVGLDGRALGFAVILAVVSGLVAGAVVAARQVVVVRRPDLRSRSGEGGGRGAHGLRQGLVVAQVGVTVTLVFGAGLLLRSYWTLTNVDPGFRAEGLLDVSLALPSSSYPEPGELVAFYDAVRERMEGLPGVEGVACAHDHPLDASWTDSFRVAGRPGEEGSGSAQLRIVCDGYAGVAGVRLLRGRDLERTDRMGATGAALVNEAFARTYLPDGEALGERLEVRTPSAFWGEASPESFEIVGVVGDVRFLGLDAAPEPAFYLPYRQFPTWGFSLMVRTGGEGGAPVAALREAVWSVDPRQPLMGLQGMDSVLRDSVARERFQMRLVNAFGAVGLLLVALSLYVLLAHAVARRSHEIGLRMAIGARPRDVRRQVVGQALRVALLGLLPGAAGAVALGRWLEGSLHGVSAADPWFLWVLGGVVVALGVVAALACSVPARRATRIDPAVALRRS